jgi:hypothetical protein
LNILSLSLEQLGEREAAIEAEREGLGYWRELVKLQPAQYLPDLAGCLNNLANQLAAAGHPVPALIAMEEAVACYRVMAKQDPPRHMPDLATALTNHSERLAENEDPRGALESIEEAVEVRRKLAIQNRDRYLSILSYTLLILSARLSAEKEFEQAVTSASEAVDHLRALADENPEAYLPEFANSLVHLSNRQGEASDAKAATKTIGEAVERYRALWESEPERYVYPLAGSLNNLSNRLKVEGQPEQALMAIEEAIVHRRALAEQDPEKYLADLAASLANLSLVLVELDRASEASALIDREREAYAGTSAESILFLSKARLHNLAEDLEGAIAAAWESMRVAEREGSVEETASARNFLRTVRTSNQAEFDQAWEEGVGGEQPDWLRFFSRSSEMFTLLGEWLETPDWAESQKYLEANEEQLLSLHALSVLEYLIDLSPANYELKRHLGLLAEAQTQDVERVFSQLTAEIFQQEVLDRLGEWLRRSGKDAVEFLQENADLLITPEAERELLKAAADQPERSRLYLYAGLVGLGRLDGPDEALLQLQEPAVSDSGICLDGGGDPRILPLLRLQSGVMTEEADSQFHHALGAGAGGFDQEARQAIRRCRRLLAEWEVADYLRRFERLIDEHPSLAEMLAALKEDFRASQET